MRALDFGQDIKRKARIENSCSKKWKISDLGQQGVFFSTWTNSLNIHHRLHKYQLDNVRVELCWIPSHIGLKLNDKADQKAKEAAKRPPALIPIFYKDYFTIVKSKIYAKRDEQWRTSNCKLRELKEDISPWPRALDIKRQEQTALNRIKTGHTLITHGYLMDSDAPQIPPVCHFCNNSTLTIKHIFTQCTALEDTRLRIFNPMTSWSLKEMIGPKANICNILRFLREAAIFGRI